MFISTIILIPWIVFGFKNPDKDFLNLNQTKKSLTLLLLTEIAYFIILFLFLGDKSPNIAGSGSFGWNYFLIYEKGVFPTQLLEYIHPTLGDKVDNYPIIYFGTALIMDYLLLLIISPKTFYRLGFNRTKSL